MNRVGYPSWNVKEGYERAMTDKMHQWRGLNQSDVSFSSIKYGSSKGTSARGMVKRGQDDNFHLALT